jgi:hypothetical protein
VPTHPALTHNDTTTINMSAGSVARLIEVLELCDQFLRSDDIRDELIEFCHRDPTLTSGWLTDMVGLHAWHLRTRLEEAAVQPLPTRRLHHQDL